MFKNVQDLDGKVVTDHIWFSMTKGFLALTEQLQQGTKVAFDARVHQYTKDPLYGELGISGYREIDYRLSHPTKIEIL